MENEKIYYINQNELLKSVIRLHICGISYPYKNYIVKRDISSVAVIEYIEKGRGVVHIDDNTFYPKEGDCYLLQSGKRHHYHSDPHDPWQKIFINFSGPLAEKIIEAYGLENTNYFPQLNIKDELFDIINAAKDSKDNPSAYISGVINTILTKMYLKLHTTKTISETAAMMKDYLDSKITSAFSMWELCEFISKSESQAINIFKKDFGITPYAYLLQKKISFAKTMLKNTNLTVKEIAYNLKFTDEYYFSNIFKSKVGISPSNYRKMQKNIFLPQKIDNN